MPKQMTPMEGGFRVGYATYEHNRRKIPQAPYPLRDPDRYLWIDGWLAGRRLAQRHHEEMLAYAATLQPGVKIA